MDTPMDKKDAIRWCSANARYYDNATELAEACAGNFNVNNPGGPLDDDTHWIWDVAMNEIDPD